MKKFLNILSVLVIVWCVYMFFQLAPTSYYKFRCEHDDSIACAKYLFVQSWETTRRESFTTNLDKQNWYYWKQRYTKNIKTQEDAYVAISTMLSSLDDPYTRFLTPEEVKEQNMSINAQLSGIGVVISAYDGRVKVEDIIENSPAEKAGIQNDDTIVKIDNISVSGLDIKKVANMIRGEKGTKVTLIIIRDKKRITKTLIRDTIKIKSVSYKKLKNNIGYIKISTFMSSEASREFLNILSKSKDKKLILDIRGNSGGLLQNATFISNLLLTDGVIVSIVGKDKHKKVTKVQSAGIHEKRPIVVLTDGMTASSSEILAAALQENKRAVLVGEKTYGKGLIQKIVPMPFDTAINVTIAKYLTPNGHDINKNGIKPDYEVKYDLKGLKKGKDNQLEKAISILNAK